MVVYVIKYKLIIKKEDVAKIREKIIDFNIRVMQKSIISKDNKQQLNISGEESNMKQLICWLENGYQDEIIIVK